MKTSQVGVYVYKQNGITKYQSALCINEKRYQKRGFLSFDEAVAYRKELEKKYLPQKVIRYDPEKVVKTYRKTESIRETAAYHKISRVKVRKLLITEGLYSTPESIKVNDLLSKGLSTEEVAEKLGMSVGSVNNLSAYRKGENKLEHPTKNAINARKWREKNASK